MSSRLIRFAFLPSVIVLMLMIFATFSQDPQPRLPIVDHRDAIEIANQFSGLHELPNVVVTAKKVALETDNAPILQERIVNHPLWQVTYRGVRIESGEKHNPYINAFDVFVDVETGHLLKITSQWSSNIDPRYRQGARISNEHLASRFAELLSPKIPEDLPKIPFVDLLKGRMESKCIEGYYIAHIDTFTQKIQTSWLIIVHGVSSLQPLGWAGKKTASPKIGYRRVVRHGIFDASTGRLIDGGGETD